MRFRVGENSVCRIHVHTARDLAFRKYDKTIFTTVTRDLVATEVEISVDRSVRSVPMKFLAF